MNRPLIAVTGANGFIGRNVCKKLTQHDYSFNCLFGCDKNASIDFEPEFSTTSDICDGKALDDVLDGVSTVVHLAGPPSVAESFKQPAKYFQSHVVGTAMLIEKAIEHGVEKLIYISSAEVYGAPLRNPVHETDRLQARSPYGAAKIAAESILQIYSNSHSIQGIVLRPFSVYGPGQSNNSLISDILKQAMVERSESILLYDLKPVRDYCFIDDVTDAVLAAVETKCGAFEIVNIGSGVGTSVRVLADSTLQALGLDCAVEQHTRQDRPASNNIYSLIADNSKAREILNWTPRFDLRSGLEVLARAEGAK